MKKTETEADADELEEISSHFDSVYLHPVS